MLFSIPCFRYRKKTTVFLLSIPKSSMKNMVSYHRCLVNRSEQDRPKGLRHWNFHFSCTRVMKERIDCCHCSYLGDKQGVTSPVPVDPVCLTALNNYDLDQVMACSADGSVRVVQGCTQDSPTLLTSWQSIPVCMPQQFSPYPATFAWQPITGDLFAAGGSMRGVIFRVGLEYQSRISQVLSSGPSLKSKPETSLTL